MGKSAASKKVAVITAGILPMPSIKGGAIETLLQYVLDANEQKKLVDYNVYSPYDLLASTVGKKFCNTKFIYVRVSALLQWIYFTVMRVLKKIGLLKDPNFQYIYMQKVIAELRKRQYDLIVVESDNHFAYGILRNIDVPVILYLHNDKLNDGTPHHTYIANDCKEIWTVSEYIKGRVLTGGADEKKIKVVKNGVDGSSILGQDKSKARREIRHKYGIDEDEQVFVFTGRLEAEKGVDKLVQAFNKMKSKARLIIVGGSFYSSNKKTKFVKNVYRLAGGNPNIIFTGYVSHDELAKYLFASDCFVLPSQWQDPAPLSNLEAMFAGLHIISSEAGGIPEYLGGTSAELLLLGDRYVERLAQAMERATKDGAKIVKYKQYFSRERYVEGFEKTLMGALDGR